jgi:UTP:GlnB (protein PII) uridylyltransferase
MRIPLAGRRRRPQPALDAEHRSQIERQTAAAVRLVGGVTPVASRIVTAPPGYLLAHSSTDLVRQCELLVPLPATGEVRVVATPAPSPGVWHLDVAARDRPRMLAAFTGVFVDAGIDVVQAVVATWDDGAALQAFIVRSDEPLRPAILQHALVASLGEPLSSAAIPDAEITFDGASSPLYTACDLVVADRPGLLHAVAVAIATAGGDVHAARVETVDGVARDRFDLSDRNGHKLDRPREDAIRAAIHSGVEELRPGRRGAGTLRSRRTASR